MISFNQFNIFTKIKDNKGTLKIGNPQMDTGVAVHMWPNSFHYFLIKALNKKGY